MRHVFSRRWLAGSIGLGVLFFLMLGLVTLWPPKGNAAREWAADFRAQSGQPGGRHARPLVLAAFRAAFRRGLVPESPNADLNARIAQSILACLPPGLSDSTGVLRSAWLVRLSSFTDDAEGMIEDLLRSESKPSDDTRYDRLADRLRRYGR